MGGSLPAIARWLDSTPQGVSWLGYFYSGNIAGAVFGCLLAGFYLLRVHDMAVATYAAASINLLAALLSIVLASRLKYASLSATRGPDRTPRMPGTMLVYLAIAMSGLTALGAEVVWTRLLSLLLGATVYTFSIILAVFLVGRGGPSIRE
jgi:spermidine synthase